MSEGRTLPAADFRPDVVALDPGSSVLGDSDVIAAEVEQVVDLIVGREEALRLADRFALFHLSLSSARRLVCEHRSEFQHPKPNRLIGDIKPDLCTRAGGCSASD